MRTLATLVLLALLAGCAAPTGPSGGPLVQDACLLPTALTPVANPHVTFDTTEGDIVLEVFRNEAPITANNFLRLVAAGHYDGVRFHRVIKDFMMQGGDGALAGKADAAAIPDEFHRLLRHDGKGILSMANAGANTGSDQFFITFAATPHLNDKHSVFGKVVTGFDVLDKINTEVAGGGDGTPKRPFSLEKATIQEQTTAAGALALSLWSPDSNHAVGTAGGDTQFLVVVQNDGDRLVPVCVLFAAPAGLTARSETGFANFDVPAKQRVAFVVEARSDGSNADATLPVTVRTIGAEATLNLTVARSDAVLDDTVATGDSVTGNYIGMTVDGRIFDTSVQSVAQYAKANGLGYGSFQVRPSYAPFSFTPGGGVIQGFTDLAVGTHAGGKAVGRIQPEDAYGASGQHALAGRTLMFQLEIVSVK
ncbi:MAG: peptidylprolyl isomerase [Candidatus Thermoplasmatota archaeon]